jgi:hypothetical protein
VVVEFEPIKGYITQMPLQLRCDHQTKFRITAGNEPKLYFLLPKSELEQQQLFPFKLSSPPPPPADCPTITEAEGIWATLA